MKHYSIRTENAHVDWIRRFVLFHDKRHPNEVGALGIEAFLTYLPANENVAASTQNQAPSALLFLFRQVLHKDLGAIDALRAKKPKRLPTVLTKEETLRLIDAVGHPKFKLLLDTKAMEMEREDRATLIRRCAQYLKHYHANDPNLNGPGWGDVDFAPIFQALRDIGYGGYVSVEVFKFEPGPEAIATKSLEYMRQFV